MRKSPSQQQCWQSGNWRQTFRQHSLPQWRHRRLIAFQARHLDHASPHWSAQSHWSAAWWAEHGIPRLSTVAGRDDQNSVTLAEAATQPQQVCVTRSGLFPPDLGFRGSFKNRQIGRFLSLPSERGEHQSTEKIKKLVVLSIVPCVCVCVSVYMMTNNSNDVIAPTVQAEACFTLFISLRFSEFLRESQKKTGAKREFYAASQIFSENLRDSQRNGYYIFLPLLKRSGSSFSLPFLCV